MKKKLIIIASAVVVLVLLGILISTNIRLSNLQEQIFTRETSLRNQMDISAEEQDKVKQAIAMLGQDSNFFRQYLQLPTRDLPIFDEEVEVKTDVPDNNVLYFTAVQALLDRQNSDRQQASYSDFLIGTEVETVLKKYELSLKNHNDFSAELWKADRKYYHISYISDDEIKLISILDNSYLINDSDSLEDKISSSLNSIELFYNNVKAQIIELSNIENSDSLEPLLKEWDLRLSTLSKSASISYRTIEHLNGTVISIGVNELTGNWVVDGIEKSQDVDISSVVTASIEKFEFRSRDEVLTQNGLTEIITLQDDDGFKAYLESLSLSLSIVPREDLYYIYFDLFNSGKELQGSFAIQKNFGDIYLMDKDDIIITSLKTLGITEGIVRESSLEIPEDLPTLAPLNLGAGDKTFLLIGANESNTDTLMVVHLSGTTGKGTIISIPRDLYYKGRKVNNIYPVFGPEQLKKTLSEITGLPIQRYMYIDMFAFADVIDVLGGIDITLDEPLIDPTYVVKDNGKWSTLHYEAGAHHLGGIETLRVARSRHTSNDFGRAARQQMILESVKNRITEMNAGAVTKIDDLVDVLMNYVKTDFSVFELLSLFLHHKDAEIDSYVLSWDNVLYHSYSNTYLLGDDVEIDENFYKGSWIMLPLNNDWNVIQWYIRNKIDKG